jgi:AAA15 family ATPase/GTPase
LKLYICNLFTKNTYEIMIQEFRVKNFMSFKDEQILSFEATKDTTSLEYLTYEVKQNVRLLKMAIIYGANASGKSNLMLAIKNLWRLLFYPKNNKEEQIDFKPFALTVDKPTEFGIVFFINSIKYQYTISYNKSYILSEKLEYAPNGIISLFYSREFMGKDKVPLIKFGDLLGLSAKSKNTFIDNTLNNHTLLSTFAKTSVDADPFKIIFEWIKIFMHEQYYKNSILDITKGIINNKKKKEFVLDSLAKADFNITQIELADFEQEIPYKKRKEIENNPTIGPLIKIAFLAAKEEDTLFTHHTENGNFLLRPNLESAGTLTFLKLLDQLYEMINQNQLYLYDEIEYNIHYDLLIHFLSLFMMNSHASQIIFTTHDQLLLDEDFIRRDMVWFTDKSKETGGTELYSAADFGLHKNLSLYKAYKVGKLGAKPELGSIFIEK